MTPRQRLLTAALFTVAGGPPLAGIVFVTVRDWKRITSIPLQAWAGGAALAGGAVAVCMLWLWGIRRLVTVIDRTYRTQTPPLAAEPDPVQTLLQALEPFATAATRLQPADQYETVEAQDLRRALTVYMEIRPTRRSRR